MSEKKKSEQGATEAKETAEAIVITKLKRKVSGGDLPEGFEVKLDVTIDFTDATKQQLAEWSFRSVWIALQGQLRKKDAKELKELSEKGLTVKATEVMSGTGTSIDMRQALKALGYADEIVELILADKDKAMEIFEQLKQKNN